MLNIQDCFRHPTSFALLLKQFYFVTKKREEKIKFLFKVKNIAHTFVYFEKKKKRATKS